MSAELIRLAIRCQFWTPVYAHGINECNDTRSFREVRAVPYEATIERTNPTAIVFLVDQSESMLDPVKGGLAQKKDGVAEVVNRFLHSLVIKCASGSGDIRPYFYVSVIGYGGSVRSAFTGPLAGKNIVCISELAECARLETKTVQLREGTKTVKTRVWIDPTADGLTPMCEAMSCAHQVVSSFVNQNPRCYPPIVINITDGDATDGNPMNEALAVQQIRSTDGNVLLFNVHVSSTDAPSLVFPNSESACKDPYARILYAMSSVLPPKMHAIGKQLNITIAEGARGFAFNADLGLLTNLVEIGTRPAIDRGNMVGRL